MLFTLSQPQSPTIECQHAKQVLRSRPRHPLCQTAEKLLLRLRPEQSRRHASEVHPGRGNQASTCRFRLSKRYTGPPGHCHGGIIATILDDAMGKVNKLRHVIALTREMTVEYIKPVPLYKPLRVEGREIRSPRPPPTINQAEILNEKNGRSSPAAKASSSPSTRQECSLNLLSASEISQHCHLERSCRQRSGQQRSRKIP